MMLIHPSPSRNNIKRSRRTQFSSPSRSPKLFSGQCMHACACTNVHIYIHMWCKVHNPPHFVPRESAPEREGERATHHMVGELSARITRATHLSYIWWEHFPYEFRLIDGWMDDAAIARFFSRYLDAHFSTILAVGILRQLNAEQY